MDILSVPLEVLFQVTSYLTTPDYGKFRLTRWVVGRAIEQRLYGAFTQEFFTKKQFSLTEFSLDALLSISKSRLGPCLKHVIIHLERPLSIFDFVPLGHQPGAPRCLYAREQECINHHVFSTSGRDIERLAEALRNLPNLVTIGMRDFNSKNRSRDGTEWHSYGTPTSEKGLSWRWAKPRPHNKDDALWVCHVFKAILQAAGDAVSSNSTPALTRLEVLLHQACLPDSALMLSDKSPNAVLAISKFTTIFLDGLGGSGFRHSSQLFPTRFLEAFLLEASNLENLRLNFQMHEVQHVDKFLDWLSTSPKDEPPTVRAPWTSPTGQTYCFQDLEPPFPDFPKLRSLELGMACVMSKTLLDLLRKSKANLRVLSLHKITLETTPRSKVNHWPRLLTKMANIPLDLETITLSYIEDRSWNVNNRGSTSDNLAEIRFANSGNSRNDRVKTWRGTTFSQSIADLTNDMTMVWRRNRNDEADSMDGNEDSDDIEDDEMGEDDEDEDMNG
ncbi:hypothetical protein GGR57DRAFT_521097 [Xylariaceae sp. FL1272]|nr:hypothetical protein GGR57DRAFT_521097 [Xylariaceae sp. FL1272]